MNSALYSGWVGHRRFAPKAHDFRYRLGLLYLDIDDFKAINDRHGPESGDAALVTVADRLRGAIRQRDLAFRLGGDEFAVLLAPVQDVSHVVLVLNRIRAEHPALRQLRNLVVPRSDDDAILVYSKTLPASAVRAGRPDGIIVVANVDPHAARQTTVHLDLPALGLPLDTRFGVTDLITGERYQWGPDNYVRLAAFVEPAHILRIDYPKGV